MTRTYLKGEVRLELQKLYDAVLHVQEGVMLYIKAGAIGSEVHQWSVDEFKKLGYDVGEEGFSHGTGHGLGLDIHEAPYLNAKDSSLLEVGNIVTVEPGLYYKKLGGVRIEDVVVVREDGCENLTNYPKELRVV